MNSIKYILGYFAEGFQRMSPLRSWQVEHFPVQLKQYLGKQEIQRFTSFLKGNFLLGLLTQTAGASCSKYG